GMIIGSIPYMSPEQGSGQSVDARSDIFSFGVLLYEALAGRRPFLGETDLQVLQAVIHESPPPLNTPIPPALCWAVEKALEKEPADRYQTMRDLVVDLRRATRAKMGAAQLAGHSARTWTAGVLALTTLVLGIALSRWVPTSKGGWHNPLEGATFTRLT